MTIVSNTLGGLVVLGNARKNCAMTEMRRLKMGMLVAPQESAVRAAATASQNSNKFAERQQNA